MRKLRSQLIQILKNAEQETAWPPRIFAVLLQQGLALLHQKDGVSFNHHQLSYQQFHRHIVMIRCPDQAFYLDAIRRYLSCHDIHPLALQTKVMAMTCDEQSCSLDVCPPVCMGKNNLMLIAIHLSAAVVEDIQTCLDDFAVILRAVHTSVLDFQPMRTRLATATSGLKISHPDDAALLQWMCDDNYLLMALQDEKQALGVCKETALIHHIAPNLLSDISALPKAEQAGIEWIHLQSAQIHLYSVWGYEVVRIAWLEQGHLQQLIVLGRFSRSARNVNAHLVPRLATIWQHVHSHPVLRLSAFYLREVRILFDRLPKPFLLSVNINALLMTLEKTVRMTDSTQLHLSCFKAQLGNIWFLFLAFESGRYGPNVLRMIVQRITKKGVQVHTHHDYDIESKRVLLISCSGTMPDMKLLHTAINDCIYFWQDRVRDLIMQQSRSLDVPESLRQSRSMPLLYQQFFEPTQFLNDMQYCATLLQQKKTQVHLVYHRQLECHFFSTQPLLLGELVFYVQNLGLQAQQEAVVDFYYQGTTIYLSSIRVDTNQTQLEAMDDARLAEALQKVINAEEDNDVLNALVVTAAMHIKEVAVLICIRNHLIQLVDSASLSILNHVMLAYPQVSAALYQLFKAKHQPNQSLLTHALQDFQQQLLQIGQLVEDRWFRALADLVQAGVRTNAFVRQAGEPVAIKVNTQQLDFAPQPKPFREIFVHGVHVEAVHLRGGKVARGGIRYSDRLADFRTEVLELMATQVLKNGVIVPTGAKGGFVIRGGTSPDFVREQYCVFMRVLLSLTDQAVDKNHCLRDIYIPDEDQHDAYLVVAADKGTASFSDFANQEALDQGFWLGDAFASGGSHGYDHKAYGITARGAWVCALHLCRRLKIDTRKPLSVVAIGDMGGDVFGNGMLCQSPLRLVAAFNHQHIFLDPNPNIKEAQQERQRLFEQRAGWGQYEQLIISEGGGVFLRSAKEINISVQIQQSLDIATPILSGEALIQAILCAEVDILFNGGIGTYVKASQQNHASVHDPVNNSVRVDAASLRCRIVCEGGNLGFSQHARLEYSQSGGLISSDAIDNSAGVDMSDHEVNIKILISHAKLETQQRDTLLRRLGEDVVQLCLNDNQEQAQLLSLAELDICDDFQGYQQLRANLLKEKRLDMRVDACIAQDDKLKIRPQLAVLMGHEKNRVYQALCAENFDPKQCFQKTLLHGYFPTYLQQHYAKQIDQHALAKEIIATQAMNQVLNHCGLRAVHVLQQQTACRVHEAVWALLLARQLLAMDQLQQDIWGNVTDLDVALALQQQCQQWLLRFARHLLSFSIAAQLCASKLQQLHQILQHPDRPLMPHTQSNKQQQDLFTTAMQSGLTQKCMQHMKQIPTWIESAAAIDLHLREGTSFTVCLQANQACLKALPFVKIEQALCANTWSEDDAHLLRCEWLQRLSILRVRAMKQLLHAPQNTFEEAAQTLWQHHVFWQRIDSIRDQTPSQMKLLLILGYLDQLLQKC